MSLVTEYIRSQFAGGGDPSKQAGWGTPEATTLTGGAPNDGLAERMGFFTDTSICIGCKACEVACKEWNRNPVDGDYELLGSSFDNTGSLGADTWRHVAFVEQSGEQIARARESGRKLVDLGVLHFDVLHLGDHHFLRPVGGWTGTAGPSQSKVPYTRLPERTT